MATATILIVLNPQKLEHTTWIFLQSFMKFDERNPIVFQIPIFCFHGNCGSLSNRFQLFGLISFHRLCMFFLLSFINFCSFLRCFIKFDERNHFFLNPPFFISMATAAKFVLPISIFIWLISFH